MDPSVSRTPTFACFIDGDFDVACAVTSTAHDIEVNPPMKGLAFSQAILTGNGKECRLTI